MGGPLIIGNEIIITDSPENRSSRMNYPQFQACKIQINPKFQCSKSSLGILRNSAISLLVMGSYLDFLYWQRALEMIRWQ